MHGSRRGGMPCNEGVRVEEIRCAPVHSTGRIDLRGSGVQADLLSCGWYHLLGVTHDGAALIRLRPNSEKICHASTVPNR